MYKRDQCRCVPCSTAMSRRNKADKMRADRGNNNRQVSAGPTRDHLRALKAAGMSVGEVARITGYSASLLERIHRGALDGTYSATEADILSVPMPRVRRYDKNRIDATGTRRRIRALVAAGHSLKAIALDAGLSHDVPTRISRVNDPHQWVHVDVAAAVRGTYDRLWNQPPTENTRAERDKATMSRNRATANGWLPPLAWDDDQIDDPDYTPNVTPMKARNIRDQEAQNRIEDLAHLINSGVPAEEAAARAGYPSPYAAHKSAQHYGLTHIAPLLLPQTA